MDKSISFRIQGEEFIFDCRRAIYWPRRKILLAADLHWGKTQYLRNHGIAISDNVFEADLTRLGSLMQDYVVETFLVLGDLIHHEMALSRGIIHRLAIFRHTFPCELILLKGNHDRFADFPESWGIVEETDFYIDDFLFAHEFQRNIQAFQFSGHVHPMMRLKGGFDSLRLPSFILAEKTCLLPAFSYLTGGQDVRLLSGEKAIVLMEEGLEVFERS